MSAATPPVPTIRSKARIRNPAAIRSPEVIRRCSNRPISSLPVTRSSPHLSRSEAILSPELQPTADLPQVTQAMISPSKIYKKYIEASLKKGGFFRHTHNISHETLARYEDFL